MAIILPTTEKKSKRTKDTSPRFSPESFDYTSEEYTDQEAAGSGVPSYFIAADSHNIANGNGSYSEGFVETVANIPKFVAASLVSGANQLYNIAPSLGNALGGDFELSDTADVMQALDDDLAAYYAKHESSVDIGGFLLSSLVPGLGGIKLLKAGQTALITGAKSGRFGAGMAKSLGLKAPSREKFVARAVKDIISSNNPFRLTDKNLLKAMATGFGQNVLEAAAFETAVAATLHDSPVLEGQDLKDFLANIAFGGLAFGAIGGILDATKSAYTVRKAVSAADAEAMPWTAVHELPAGSSASDRLLNYYDQIHNSPEVPAVFSADRQSYLKSAAETRANKLRNRIRTEFSSLSGGDEVVAQQLFERSRLGTMDDVLGDHLGTTSATRLADKSAAEIERAKKIGEASKTLDEEGIIKAMDSQLSYIRNWGEDAGRSTFEAPKPIHLVDTLSKSEAFEVLPVGVKAGKKLYSFKPLTPKTLTTWDATAESVLASDARGLWMRQQPAFKEGQLIYQNDIHALERAYRDFDTSYTYHLNEGGTMQFQSKNELLNFITDTKESLAVQMLKKRKNLSQDEIAAALNLRSSRLNGELSQDTAKDVFAVQSYSKEYSKRLVDAGLRKTEDGIVDVATLPQHIKMITDTKAVKDLDGNVLEGMSVIRQRYNEYQMNIDRTVAGVLGTDSEKLIAITDEDILRANRIGAGSGFAAAASANYGSLASKVEYLGNAVTGMIEKAKSGVRETVEPELYKLAQNPEAAVELSALNAKLRGIPMPYTLSADGKSLIPTQLKRYQEALAAGKRMKEPVLRVPDAPLEIPIKNDATRNFVKLHIEQNGTMRGKQVQLRAAQGMEHKVDLDSFYPIPADPRAFPFFATVTDSSITGTGHTKTLYAATQKELDDMIRSIEGEPGLTVRTKGEAEEYYKSIGQFDYDKTIHENFIDGALHRKGVSAPYFISTDPQKIVNEFLTWHTDRASGLVRETVAAKYEKQFTELRTMGDRYTRLATSKVGSLSNLKHAEEVVENPFMDYVKTALGIRNYSDYPFWTSANRSIESKFSQMYSRITKITESSKGPEDLLKINDVLKEYGYKGAAYTEDMELLANHTAPKAVLSGWIQKANALLATVVLRLDALNAVNNTVGATVLLGSETKSVLEAIGRGGEEAVGDLAKLTKVAVPGTDKQMFSATKLIANSIKKFGKDTTEMQFYKDNRFITSISDQYKWTLDKLTLNGTESVRDLGSKISDVQTSLTNFANKGERWTGNKLAEEFNRFVAADVMKQITDVAIKHGVMDNKTALSYINTFVNRTQGNYLAAQRPMMFQGPVGQAIGLFQTYQFNLMQQLLRHVGEGTAKDTATLLGLQGTIYGLNGLPAFNAINTHVIGTASGNTAHKDAYSTVYGAVGKNAGDWLMYGAASNILLDPDLKINLYVRGDINPRHVTIVPTNPADVPIVGAATKFFGNLFNTADKLMEGGDVSTTLLQGLEHNGISRPLAGLAQVLKGIDNPYHASYSTSNRGNVIASNDLMSLSNLARLAGGKPLGEAIATDMSFRFRSYAAHDAARREVLGEAIKSKIIAGGMPTQDEVEEFAYKYAKAGGKQTEFNKWMMYQYKKANTSQANEMQRNLSKPYAQDIQTIMGGYELRDFIK